MNIFIVVHVEGGAGKTLMSTALIEGLKKKYPERKIITISGYPEIFFNNPNVYRSFRFTECQYFYEDYIKEDTLVFKHNPYNTNDYIQGVDHLIPIWFKLCGLDYDDEQPKLYYTSVEQMDFISRFKSDKRVTILFNPFGGGDTNQYHWYRDIHPEIAQNLVNYFTQKGLRVVQNKTVHQLPVPGAEHYVAQNIRDLIMLVASVDKLLLIDSFAQHIAAAVGKKATVLWATERQRKIFGYDLHNNIISGRVDEKFSRHAIYEQFNFGGDPLEYPLPNGEHIYDLDLITKTINGKSNSKDTTCTST